MNVERDPGMRKITKTVFCIMWAGLTVLLSGCAMGENSDHYERKQFQSAESVSS